MCISGSKAVTRSSIHTSMQAQRKKEKKLMFKRNKKGQPVMKHRVEHILQGLGAV